MVNKIIFDPTYSLTKHMVIVTHKINFFEGNFGKSILLL